MPSRRVPSGRGAALALAVSFTIPPALPAATGPDSSLVAALREYDGACRADAGRLWGRSLCGPLVLVEPGTRHAVALERPPGGEYRLEGGAYTGRIPDGIPTANFALSWAGTRWSMVLTPLPDDALERLGLLLHESFHRIQPALALGGGDPLNAHLDERDGRYWLRLELRALATALRAPASRREAPVRDAMLFRAYRRSLYPGADTLEDALELGEGLAEYTGIRLALDALHRPIADAAPRMAAFEERPSYVRALGYGTGPALGLLLDRYRPDWRSRVAREGFGAQLLARFGPRGAIPLAEQARDRATGYDDGTLARAEDERDEQRRARLEDFRALLIRGPVLVLTQASLSRSFNPNTLVPLGDDGTVYPSGTFSADWGSLELTDGAALVSPDYRRLVVARPDTGEGREVPGPGYTLRLAEGWRLVPGERAGDLTVRGP